MAITDNIFWWIGCLTTYFCVLFIGYCLFCLLVEFVYKRCKYHAKFIEFLQWQRKQKIKKIFPSIQNIDD